MVKKGLDLEQEAGAQKRSTDWKTPVSNQKPEYPSPLMASPLPPRSSIPYWLRSYSL